MNKPPCMVWLPADHRLLGDHDHQAPFLVLGDKYARAVRVGAQAQPVVFPLAQPDQIGELLQLVDGVMLTGSAANVHPSHFDEPVLDASLPLDEARDSLTLALVKACVAQRVPLLGICRGFQEINVALGGSLHQQVHTVPGLLDHREPSRVAHDVQYAPVHAVQFVAGSVFQAWAQGPNAKVNSLHGQGVARLASGLTALGHAPDGLVEAFGVSGASSFAYAVQWHPEWRCLDNCLSLAMFRAFGEACRARQSERLSQSADRCTNEEVGIS
ncbi:gamma-glutamyl-gamma-aminobutyrate hydrolase family protein [Rhodoferax sp.]|uniref:gamma-glutamyl-gamma-aminobutyrate hydrolase family protein n=1 Tax=Rhodoferax sp. TaxID=50421 RepID=UPI00276DD853|nr:gamma-glutamyl-gamma-aminobutyrate hydrolase family protein [Rhodoferax sp.]